VYPWYTKAYTCRAVSGAALKRNKRMRMILPVPLPAAALANFAVQIPDSQRRADIQVDFVGCRAGASLMDSPYESTLADAFVLDAGAMAETDGYDLVCSFSMSELAYPTPEAIQDNLFDPIKPALG
jgi:hypothetical protein